MTLCHHYTTVTGFNSTASMGDKSSFLSLAVPDLDTQDPYFSNNVHETILMHSDESMPSYSLHLPLHDTSRGQQSFEVDSPLSALPATQHSSLTQKNHHNEENKEVTEANYPPLCALFSVNPIRAAGAISPGDEDVLMQRRWRADTAEVEAYLTRLDLAREECAVAGLYAKATACMHRMEQAVHLFAKRLHAEIDAVTVRTQERVTVQQKRERFDLCKAWRDRIAAYKHDAATLVAAARHHHYAQLEEEDMEMRADLLRRSGDNITQPSNITVSTVTRGGENSSFPVLSPSVDGPSWSREVQHLQVKLQQVLHQRRYRDAERVRAQLQTLERQEATDHKREITQQHIQRLQALKAAQAAEVSEMQATQRQEIHEMVLAGRAAVDKLAQRHLAELQALEERRQHLHAKTREVLQGYKHADVLDPKGTGLKLIRLSQLLWTPLSKTRR